MQNSTAFSVNKSIFVFSKLTSISITVSSSSKILSAPARDDCICVNTYTYLFYL